MRAEERTRSHEPIGRIPQDCSPVVSHLAAPLPALTSPSINYTWKPLCQLAPKCNHQSAGLNLDFQFT